MQNKQQQTKQYLSVVIKGNFEIFKSYFYASTEEEAWKIHEQNLATCEKDITNEWDTAYMLNEEELKNLGEYKEIWQMDYSEFSEFVEGQGFDRFEQVLAYEDFSVYKDKESGKYYYLEESENDASDFFQVELIARLEYSIVHDINENADTEHLIHLFDCCCCGEYVSDNAIEYLWFDRVQG